VSVGDWLAPALSFVGGGAGAWLAFITARSSTQQAEAAGRREEWGRRFAQALGLLADEHPRQRQIGRALLVQLLDSELATDDDRATADRIIALDAEPTRTQLAALPAPDELDAARFVRDDGLNGDDDEGSSER
jgi:hypothetical protein